MAKDKDSEIEAVDTATSNSGPLLLEGPKTDTPIIDLEALHAGTAESASSEEGSETAAPPPESRWRLPAYAPLAAAMAFSVALGAIAGAATSSLMQDKTPPASATTTRALQDTVAQLGNDLATLKTSLASTQRSTSSQVGKLAERVDRSEKALAEPTAKLAKIQESIDRLDHRSQQTAAIPAPAPEVTGSVTAPKEESRPQVAEGWRLRDFYAGRAVVESRNGMLFEVVVGSNLPGLGRVENVKRENGRVVVVTRNGIIAASLEPRHPSYPSPYRY